MKSYLRFLFLGAVLLTLLGIFNGRQNDPVQDPSGATALEQLPLQDGFLPLDPNTDVYRAYTGPCPPAGNPEDLRPNQEAHLSTLMKNRVQQARRISADITFDLLQKTGHLIHERCSAEIPA